MSTYFVLYIQKKDFVQMLRIHFSYQNLPLEKPLQKYFCKKDTCDQNENIYIDWLVINSKFKLKTVNSILHYLCYYLPNSKYYTKKKF